MIKSELETLGVLYDETVSDRIVRVPMTLVWSIAAKANKPAHDAAHEFMESTMREGGLDPKQHYHSQHTHGYTEFRQDKNNGISETLEESAEKCGVEELLCVLEEKLSLKTVAGKRALRVFCENVQLLDAKQVTYGSKNISLTGMMGLAVRLNDKVQRMLNLLSKSIEPNFESMEDTCKDISCYGAIASLVLTHRWPEE